MGKETTYSINTRNKEKINRFFARAGYSPKYGGKTEPAAIGMGQEVVRFRVPGFDPWKLEGRLLDEWQGLPIEIIESRPALDKHKQKRQKSSSKKSYESNIDPTQDFWNSDIPMGYLLGSKCPRCGKPTDTPGELCLGCCLS